MSNLYNLIARFEFWFAKRFIKLDKHYTFFVDLNGQEGSFAIKYLKKYNGVIVEFANVKISGDDGQLTFDYDVIANPNNHNTKSSSFIRFTSNVMRNILYNAIENGMREENENRNIDPVKSNAQREVYEESVAVSEERVPERKPRKKAVRRNKTVHTQV